MIQNLLLRLYIEAEKDKDAELTIMCYRLLARRTGEMPDKLIEDFKKPKKRGPIDK